jgi:hypothetical protein
MKEANKVTDEQIIKALECCIESTSRNDCEDLKCPACDEIGCYFMNQSTEYYPESLIQEMGKAVLDLITRQKAEIERLQTEKAKLHKLIPKMIKEAKSEAYKEVAERFKYFVLHEDIEIVDCKCTDYQNYVNGANQFRHQVKNGIDNLLNELTEGGNEDG